MSSHQVKDHVRDQFEGGFDTLHRIADVVTFPLAPLDGAIHGTARGILNWLTDTHPAQRNNGQSFWPPQQQQQQQQQSPQYGGGYYGYPNNSPPPPPSYGGHYWQGQPQPYYRSQEIQNVKNGHNNNTDHNNGAIKIGNFGGA